MRLPLDTVVLVRDLPAHGLRRGDVGAAVDVLGDEMVEVEFVLASGRTQALVEVNVDALRRVDDNDLPSVRHVEPLPQGVA